MRIILVIFIYLLSFSLFSSQNIENKEKKENVKKEINKTPDTNQTQKIASSKGDASAHPETKGDIETVKKQLKTIKEKKESLNDFEEAYKLYESQASSYYNYILDHVKTEYSNKRKFIKLRYDKLTKELMGEEEIKRKQAINVMEDFIIRYPNNKKYTPDVLFRLADLYFEKEELDYSNKKDEYENKMDAYESGKTKVKPIEPEKKYTKTLYYFKRIINEFPEYKEIAGSYYLTGYIYLQLKADTDNERKKNIYSEQAFRYFKMLVDNYPDSNYTARAYLRIAEYYYDKRPESDKPATYYKYFAIKNYKKALNVKGNDVYDYAMYKMAWSYYTVADSSHINDYNNAIDIFSSLVQKYDTNDEDEIKLYREEAISFTAISFVEGFENNTDVLKKYVEKQGKPEYAREVLSEVARAYYDGALWKISIQIYNMIFEYYPLHPENPAFYDFIISAYAKLGDEKGAIEARERFLKDYKKGSPWYNANADNEKAMALLQNFNARYLYDSAAYHYNNGYSYLEKGENDKAMLSFGMAASLYDNLLINFPLNKDYYKIQFYYAETLYLLKQYKKAITMFKKVRDNNEHIEFTEDSSRRLIDCYEGILKEKIKNNELKLAGKPDSEKLASEDKIEKLKMPKEYIQLIKVRDEFIKMFPKDKDAPIYSFKSANDYYRHYYFEEARKRYFKLMQNYPDSEPAKYALEDIYFSYMAQRKYDEAEQFYANIIKDPKYSNLKKEDLENIKTLQSASVFKKAEQFYKNKKYEKAALAYMSLYKNYPNSPNALQALRNADFAYKEAKTPLKRINLLKEINKYIRNKKKLFSEKKYKIEVSSNILTIADISERFFDFNMTINYYEKYLKEFPNGGDVKFVYSKLPQLYYNNKNYQKSASFYLKYGSKLDEKNHVLYIQNAIAAYKKAQAWNKVIKTYKLFIKTFGKKPKYRYRAVIMNYYIYETYLKLNQKKNADKYLRNTYKIFAKLKQPNDLKSPLGKEYLRAKYLASKTNFLQVEKLLPIYERMPVGGRNPLINIKKKIKYAVKMTKLYNSLIAKYKEPEWAIAAYFRKGYLNKQFAEALFAVKAPKNLDEDEQDAYKEDLEDFAEPYLDTAEKLYKEAYTYAIKLNIDNDWTKKLLLELNKIDKDTYKIPKKLIDKENRILKLEDNSIPLYEIKSKKSENTPDNVEEDGK